MTAACWISDGTPVPPVPLRPPHPGREWRLGRWRLARAPRLGRWSCSVQGGMTPDGEGRLTLSGRSCGIAGARTPVGALFAVLRMLREG